VQHGIPFRTAIRVGVVDETRSKERRLLMDGGVTSAVMDLEKRQR
jgi:hypothetical protein